MIHLHYFGIDVSKNWIDVALYSKAMKTHRFDNNTAVFGFARKDGKNRRDRCL
jgi:hypothetical protein